MEFLIITLTVRRFHTSQSAKYEKKTKKTGKTLIKETKYKILSIIQHKYKNSCIINDGTTKAKFMNKEKKNL